MNLSALFHLWQNLYHLQHHPSGISGRKAGDYSGRISGRLVLPPPHLLFTLTQPLLPHLFSQLHLCYNLSFCKSLLCSLFNEQTCSRFTWLFGWSVVTMPKISLKTLYCYIFEKPKVQGHQNWYSQLSNTQIHKYKYKYTNTNTQIQLCWSARNTKHMLYF